jgi:hypothetical protein
MSIQLTTLNYKSGDKCMLQCRHSGTQNSKIRKAIQELQEKTEDGVESNEQGGKLYEVEDLGMGIGAQEKAAMMAWMESETRKIWKREMQMSPSWEQAVRTVENIEEGDVVLMASIEGMSTASEQ